MVDDNTPQPITQPPTVSTTTETDTTTTESTTVTELSDPTEEPPVTEEDSGFGGETGGSSFVTILPPAQAGYYLLLQGIVESDLIITSTTIFWLYNLIRRVTNSPYQEKYLKTS